MSAGAVSWLRRANVWRKVTSPDWGADRLTGETTRPQPRCDGIQPMKHTATQALVTIAIALAIVVAVKVIQARAATPFPAEMLGSWCRSDVHEDGRVPGSVAITGASNDLRCRLQQEVSNYAYSTV